MRVDQFDFDLPDEAIALRPARPRDHARLLAVRPFDEVRLSDHAVLDLVDFLRPGDALVFNDTRVIPAQLAGRRTRQVNGVTLEAKIDITLHLRNAENSWRAFAKPAKKLDIGDHVHFDDLSAEVVFKADGGEVGLRFNQTGPALDAAIARIGSVPLPPYISSKRHLDAQDIVDYQTIYAKAPGAVAAPTAGLHTTQRLLDCVAALGVHLHYVTLHVGAGTFLPVKAEETTSHQMHREYGCVREETATALNHIRAAGGRIVAIGTTSLRLLESASDKSGQLHPYAGETDIFITPGYHFRVVDLLMTNFHLPRSTLFMLVSAFCGLEVMRQAYQHAIDTGYRFYSYGDHLFCGGPICRPNCVKGFAWIRLFLFLFKRKMARRGAA